MEIEPPNDVLQAAVDYAKRGVSVFAIATGSKRPHTTFAPHGFRSATTDTAAIERWFERETVTAIATEPGASGCVVLDLDDRHGGYDSIAALQHRLRLLPLTRTAITLGGGEH